MLRRTKMVHCTHCAAQYLKKCLYIKKTLLPLKISLLPKIFCRAEKNALTKNFLPKIKMRSYPNFFLSEKILLLPEEKMLPNIFREHLKF